jgi:ArsR family transcriptional regulator, virulence genes transcriptional regulator
MNIRIEGMRVAAAGASELLKALANPHRLMLVCQMAEKERSVGELAAELGLRDSTVSQHLALLRKDGLVAARRDGQTMWYSIAQPAAKEIIDVLYRSFCEVPARPAAAVRSGARQRKRG